MRAALRKARLATIATPSALTVPSAPIVVPHLTAVPGERLDVKVETDMDYALETATERAKYDRLRRPIQWGPRC